MKRKVKVVGGAVTIEATVNFKGQLLTRGEVTEVADELREELARVAASTKWVGTRSMVTKVKVLR